MSTITASAVNELRQKTGAGLMDCKKALQESNGDFETAIDYLRKKGQKVAALRNDREAKEGVVYAAISADGKTGIIVGLGCETDFVAKNEEFVKFAQAAGFAAISKNVKSLDELRGQSYEGLTFQDKVNEMVGKIGEKIELKRFQRIEAETVISYIHSNNKLGVLVGLNKPANEKIEAAGKDIAMQIAAMNPIALNKDEIPEEVIAREREIAMEQIKAEGKPENMVEKILPGKLNKFFKENTLLNQQFVKDNSKTVTEILQAIEKDLTVTSFKRVTLVG